MFTTERLYLGNLEIFMTACDCWMAVYLNFVVRLQLGMFSIEPKTYSGNIQCLACLVKMISVQPHHACLLHAMLSYNTNCVFCWKTPFVRLLVMLIAVMAVEKELIAITNICNFYLWIKNSTLVFIIAFDIAQSAFVVVLQFNAAVGI